MVNITSVDPKKLEDYNSLGQEAFFKNHYDLSDLFDGTPLEWKEFLSDPELSDYIVTELNLIHQSEMRKLLRGISNKSSSVGTAQMVTALSKAIESGTIKEGPAYIYSYVPLTPHESHGNNTRILTEDIFQELK